MYMQLIQLKSFTPCFFLHVLPDLKEQQFDYMAHCPCYSISPPLQFSSNDPAKGDVSLELDDYGQMEIPTSFLQNRIAFEYYQLFQSLHQQEVQLPHTTLLHLTLRQKKQFTLHHLLLPLPFMQRTHPPPAVCTFSDSFFILDENGFTPDSSRGHRIVKWDGESTVTQREAMQFNLQLMKWRLFPSLNVASFAQ